MSQEAGLYEHIHLLASKNTLSIKERKELNNIDKDLMHILVHANQNCVKAGNAPWSPQLHEAYLIHHYWNLKLSQKQMGQNYPHTFTMIEQQIIPSRLQPAHLLKNLANLWAAQKLLRDIQKVAQEKWQTHLDKLILATGICKDRRKRKLILCLKRAKELQGYYAMVRSITKPKQMGGISHVKIPTNNDPAEPTWENVYDPKEIKWLVLQQH